MKGHLLLTDERKNLITENWQTMSDYEMGRKLNLYPGSIALLRQRLGLLRKVKTEITSLTKAFVINAFFNHMRTKSIMKMTGLTYYQVNYIIDKNCFYKQRSYNTITLVMDSKVNY